MCIDGEYQKFRTEATISGTQSSLLLNKYLLAGVLTEEYLREIMTTMGDRWTDEMVDELLHGAPISVSVMSLKSAMCVKWVGPF